MKEIKDFSYNIFKNVSKEQFIEEVTRPDGFGPVRQAVGGDPVGAKQHADHMQDAGGGGTVALAFGPVIRLRPVLQTNRHSANRAAKRVTIGSGVTADARTSHASSPGNRRSAG